MESNLEKTTVRSELFWFYDGSFTLQAENTLFKVHKSVLERSSEYFENLLKDAMPSKTADGTDEAPMVLPEVTSDQFTSLLKVIYTEWPELNELELIDVLQVAHRLSFTAAHGRAKTILHPKLDVSERLAAALSVCGADEWAFPSFVDLVYDAETEASSDRSPLNPLPKTWIHVYTARSAILKGRMSLLPNMCEPDRAYFAGFLIGRQWKPIKSSCMCSCNRNVQRHLDGEIQTLSSMWVARFA
ncbi:hypothetical protein BKA62DRAFT_718913 [Auriculariales sp. MPI-PUGE-AT-0066]|nr:hypothetical protein BKA62DRAFT_718913 [Auriculariales sp. MPI-PUGE-AT-0066]